MGKWISRGARLVRRVTGALDWVGRSGDVGTVHGWVLMGWKVAWRAIGVFVLPALVSIRGWAVDNPADIASYAGAVVISGWAVSATVIGVRGICQRRKVLAQGAPMASTSQSIQRLALMPQEPTKAIWIDRKRALRILRNSSLVRSLLVLCSQSLFRFADLGDDGLCRGGPDKGCGVIVSAIDVVVDRLD